MSWRPVLVALALVGGCLFVPAVARAQSCPALSAERQADLLAEHLYGGPPSDDALLVRRAYVTAYDADHRVPRWTAWRVVPEYLDTPSRTGRWAAFRTDPDVAGPVTDGDYRGVGPLDMARGHIAPYFIAGGDRDGDGALAEDDVDDACTIYEINYLSNVAPQYQSRFNGSGGLWYELETRIRRDIVGIGMPVHVIAGTVFDDDLEIMAVGNGHIPVPHMFFQILITDVGVVPFLFVHTAPVGPHRCPLDAELQECIVAIEDIEAVTGLDFFAGFDADFEAVLQTPDGAAVWLVLVGP